MLKWHAVNPGLFDEVNRRDATTPNVLSPSPFDVPQTLGTGFEKDGFHLRLSYIGGEEVDEATRDERCANLDATLVVGKNTGRIYDIRVAKSDVDGERLDEDVARRLEHELKVRASDKPVATAMNYEMVMKAVKATCGPSE